MRYRKKPVVVEAERFYPEHRPWPEGVVFRPERNNGDARRRWCGTFGVPTLEGFMIASPGDWIITGVKGERYPCKPDVFEATYEAVGDDT